MFPINLLGDAAAGEEMVKQTTRKQRPDQRAQEDLFERQLRLRQDELRLNSVHPTLELTADYPIYIENEELFKQDERRRNRSFSRNAFHDVPRTLHEDFQLLLFDLSPTEAEENYHKADLSEELGILIDRTA